MSDATFKRDLEFLYEVGCLRFVQRTWRQFLNPNFANLSEHTLRVIWTALVIAKHEGVTDTTKVVKMALVHDLSESRSVDVHYVSRQFVDRHEEEALTNTLEKTALEDEYLALWKEYEKRDCLEAKIVKDADNLDVDLELKEQEARGFTLKAKIQSMRDHVGATKLYTKTAQKMWREIQKAEPNDWHFNSVNRFNSGDWKK
jgi:putative hydrolases of HD superfamily